MENDIFIPEMESEIRSSTLESVCINQLFSFYHQRLLADEDSLSLLEARGIDFSDVQKGRWGLCDRALNKCIPPAKSKSGAAHRGILQRIELLKGSGHELFRGCVVEPCLDVKDEIIAANGIKLNKRIRRNKSQCLTWYRYKSYQVIPKFISQSWEV